MSKHRIVQMENFNVRESCLERSTLYTLLSHASSISPFSSPSHITNTTQVVMDLFTLFPTFDMKMMIAYLRYLNFKTYNTIFTHYALSEQSGRANIITLFCLWNQCVPTEYTYSRSVKLWSSILKDCVIIIRYLLLVVGNILEMFYSFRLYAWNVQMQKCNG